MTNYNSSNNNKNVALYIFLIAALLLVNGFLFYHNYKTRKENTVLKEQGISLVDEKNQLQVEYNETIAVLDKIQKENQELSGQLGGMQEEIESQKSQISSLLSKSNVSKKDLANARALLSQLRGQAESYQAQIQQLENANFELSQANQNLQQTVVIKDAEKSALEEEKVELQEKKADLEEEKAELEATVERSKVLVSSNIVGEGIKVKKNDKRVQTTTAKKVDELNICFDIMPHTTIDTNEEVHIRILTPEGVTLSLGEGGSGKFQVANSDKMLNYSLSKDVSGFEKRRTYCTTWIQNTEYAPGIYSLELYHKGKKIGNNSFELKKGFL